MSGVILAVLPPQATYPLHERQTWVCQCVYATLSLFSRVRLCVTP